MALWYVVYNPTNEVPLTAVAHRHRPPSSPTAAVAHRRRPPPPPPTAAAALMLKVTLSLLNRAQMLS